MQRDFLIVGAGLAGCLAAWELTKRGKTFLLIDDPSVGSASQTAAGIINPVTGKRFVLLDNFAALLDEAKATYTPMEKACGQAFLQKTSIIRIFKNAEEYKFWNEERAKPEQLSLMKRFHPAGIYQQYVRDDFGSLTFDGYTVDGRALIAALRSYFQKHFREIPFHRKNLQFQNNAWVWEKETFEHVLFCEGFRARQNPWFDWIPFKHAKGEILIIETEHPTQPEGILNFGKWMQPLGRNIWKIGSTFEWEIIDENPSEAGRKELTASLQKYSPLAYQIVDQLAGVRPVVRDLQPILGTHPSEKNLHIFNGLGAKGFLYAPLCARILCEAILEGKPLPEHLSVSRFLSI